MVLVGYCITECGPPIPRESDSPEPVYTSFGVTQRNGHCAEGITSSGPVVDAAGILRHILWHFQFRTMANNVKKL